MEAQQTVASGRLSNKSAPLKALSDYSVKFGILHEKKKWNNKIVYEFYYG